MEELLKTKRSSLLSSLVSQGMTLKICLMVAGAIILVETVCLVCMGFKKPLIVSLENNRPELLTSQIDDGNISIPEFRAFIVEILSQKFSKTPTAEHQKLICRYFTEGLRVACENEALQKKLLIPQDFIIEEMAWNERTEAALLKIKRFATFNGIVSAIEAKLSLKLQKRQRNLENPWGIFISEWKEEVQK